LPFTALLVRAYRAVGMGVFVVHVSVAGSYSSTVFTPLPKLTSPPIAYIFSLIAVGVVFQQCDAGDGVAVGERAGGLHCAVALIAIDVAAALLTCYR
jgi:hypothetical protein